MSNPITSSSSSQKLLISLTDNIKYVISNYAYLFIVVQQTPNINEVKLRMFKIITIDLLYIYRQQQPRFQ